MERDNGTGEFMWPSTELALTLVLPPSNLQLCEMKAIRRGVPMLR